MVRNGSTPGKKIRWRCLSCRYVSTNPGGYVRGRGGVSSAKVVRRIPRGTKTLVVSWAQNATPKHDDFWGIMEQIAKNLCGERIIIKGRLKNPTSRWTASQANDEIWEIAEEFLADNRIKVNQNLIVLADIKVQATSSRPLAQYHSITGGASAILGHPRVEMQSVAAPSNRMAKVVVTTGACTVPNYTDTAAGAAGAFHHTIGCLVVEVRGNKFWLRNVTYDEKTKSAIDMGTRYYANRREKAPRPAALVMGDTHVGVHDPRVDRATFGRRGIVPMLRPRHLLWHDVFDGHSCNPHHAGDPIATQAKYRSRRGGVLNELRAAAEHVRARTTGDVVSVVVQSNHHKFLERWIHAADWRFDPGNAEFYLATALEMVKGASFGPGGIRRLDPFVASFPQLVDMANIRVLGPRDKFALKGVTLDMHGHRGPNGARGSAMNLRNIGVKSIIGHSHGPCVKEGCWQVGCNTWMDSSGGLDYTEGAPSSSLHVDCILNDDGKRQQVFIVDGLPPPAISGLN
jgi:hypothetical protein